uniref:Uncharacterized protein n=1 Tax=Strongyloides papillosus TaxID=174720 RepID=A0A0N5CFT5_STREA
MFTRFLLFFFLLILPYINCKIDITVCFTKIWKYGPSEGVKSPQWDNHPANTTVEVFFLSRVNSTHFNKSEGEELRNVVEMYLPIDSYQGMTYPCLSKTLDWPKTKEDEFKLKQILLHSTQKEEFAFSFIQVKYKNIKYEKLPFEGHVLTREDFLLIDTELGIEYVIPATPFMKNGILDGSKIVINTTPQETHSIKIGSLSFNNPLHFLSILSISVAAVCFVLFICMIILLICSCTQRTEKNKKLRMASMTIEREMIIKGMNEINKEGDDTSTGTDDEV